MAVVLRNNGQLPASARMEAAAHAAFALLDGPRGSFVVEPGRSVAFSLQFSPSGPGPASHELRLKVT
jgi:hypothetical protein